MPSKKTQTDSDGLNQRITAARREQELREKTYRERALKIYPWICARCGRELEGKKLRELTVHHKDHNHENNPPDGGNWELLCIYCHDNEHTRYLDQEWYDDEPPGQEQAPLSTHKPFAALEALIKDKK